MWWTRLKTLNHTVWGLVSDVHGNLPALEQALHVLSAAGVQRFAFLGDYLGRGDSDACVRMIRSVADVAILGNRDLDWQDRVAPDTRRWVLELPRTAQRDGLLLSHGDARLTPALSTAQLIRDLRKPFAEMQRRGTLVWAFGHSHNARTWRKASDDAPAELLRGPDVALEPPFRYALNVGTTGLPFPGKGGPSVAVVDFSQRMLRHMAVGGQREAYTATDVDGRHGVSR
ncbi:MAG: metallophosphoesterase family protein [Chloroflexota bacterium]